MSTYPRPMITNFQTVSPMRIQKYQRYLPSAFDDSLTMLEKINKTIEHLNQIGEISNSVVEQWNDVMEWILNNGLTEEVNAKLQEMVQNGTMDTIINENIFNELNTIINNVNQNVGDISNLATEIVDDVVSAVNSLETNKAEEKYKNTINIIDRGAVPDWDGNSGTDNGNVIQNVADEAEKDGKSIFIPKGRFFIDKELSFYTDVICEGEIIVKSDSANITNAVEFVPSVNPINVDPFSLGGLEKLSTQITGLPNGFRGATLVITSSEPLINRHGSTIPYYKNDTQMIVNNNGGILPALDQSYTDKGLMNVKIKPQEKPINVWNLNITFVGDTQTEKQGIRILRSGVSLHRPVVNNESNLFQLRQTISLDECVSTTLNSVITNGAQHNGLGYGILTGNTAFTTLNDCHLNDARHAVTGRHSKVVRINGGSFNRVVDCHWGNDFVIDGAVITGSIQYAGTDITVINSTFYECNGIVIYRTDTPYIAGKVTLDNNKVINLEPSYTSGLYHTLKDYNGYDFGLTMQNPSSLTVTNNQFHQAVSKHIYYVRLTVLEYANVPIQTINIHDNTTVNDNRKFIQLEKNNQYQPDTVRNPRINISNEDLNGSDRTSSDRNISIKDFSPTFDTVWGYEIFLSNVKDLNSMIDDNCLAQMNCVYSRVREVEYFNDTPVLDTGYWFRDCELFGFHISVNSDIQLVNCNFRGSCNYDTSTTRLHKGNVAGVSSEGFGTLDLDNYKDTNKFQ